MKNTVKNKIRLMRSEEEGLVINEKSRENGCFEPKKDGAWDFENKEYEVGEVFKAPVGMVVEVRERGARWERRYYQHEDVGNGYGTYPSGVSEYTVDEEAPQKTFWDEAKYTDSQWMVWFGGDCPVQGNCIVEVVLRNGKCFVAKAGECFWDHVDLGEKNAGGEVIGFRTLRGSR